MSRYSFIKHHWGSLQYVALLVGASTVFLLVVLLSNIDAVVWMLQTTNSVYAMLELIFLFIGGAAVQLGYIGVSFLVLFAFLVTLNLIFLVQFTRRSRQSSCRVGTDTTLVNAGSVIAAVLGIGCASCGGVILIGLLSLFGASGLVVWLPFGGIELAAVGVAGLAWSNWYLLGQLDNGIVCRV